MGFESAAEIVDGLTSCPRLAEFLEHDVQSKNEVAFCFDEEGNVYQFREGAPEEVTVTLPSRDYDAAEQRVVVHTHPSIDAVMNGGVTMSPSDEAVGDHPAIDGMIALSMEMFELHWYGEAVLFSDSGRVVEKKAFEIEANGTTDGPTEERWVADPRVIV